jgi:hypothetical protein
MEQLNFALYILLSSMEQLNVGSYVSTISNYEWMLYINKRWFQNILLACAEPEHE